MTFQVTYWHSEHNSKTGVVGGLPSGEALGFLGNQVELEDITSPGQGQGKLFVFSKHYVSVSNFSGYTQLEQLDLSILNKTSPEDILIAPAASNSQTINNGSHHYSSVTGVEWSNGVSPEFTTIYGDDSKAKLSNGSFYIITGAGESHGFWIRREFSENYYLTGEASATFSVSTPSEPFSGDTPDSPRPDPSGNDTGNAGTGDGGTGTGDSGGNTGAAEDLFPAPDPPEYSIPLEADCDIVVDASDLTISFFGNFTGSPDITSGNWSAQGLGMQGWTDAQLTELVENSGGNPIGSQRNEINLIAQAINMAVRDKEYYTIIVTGANADTQTLQVPVSYGDDWLYDGYADRLGPIVVGVKGNGGTIKCMDGAINASPASRISNNKPDIYDSSHNFPKKPGGGKLAYADGISGAPEEVASHGFDITYVGLDTGAQMAYQVHGPSAGKLYDPDVFYSKENKIYSSDSGNERAQAPCRHLEMFNMKLRPSSYGGDTQYFYMIGHIQGHMYVEGCEFMPLDLSSDTATSYDQIGSPGSPPYIYADGKSCMRLNHQVFTDTVLKGNGTSRNFPASAQLATYTGATDLVSVHEHMYYLKDGGNVWIIDHGTGKSPFHVVTSDRTMFQVRPEFADVTDPAEAKYSGQSPDTNWGYGRNGTIVIKDNLVEDHGTQLFASDGLHPDVNIQAGGGAVMTVWRNTTGNTYYYDNVVTGSYYNCMAAVAQSDDRNMYSDEHGYPIDAVYVRNNTLHSTSDTSRETLVLGGIHRIHLLSGNNVSNEGGKETTFGDSLARSTAGFKQLCDLLVEHENVDFSGDFGPEARYVDVTDGPGTFGTYVDIDMSDPSGSLDGHIEWLKV